MKVIIDFSVVTEETGAFGNITGELTLSAIPQVGDSISFLFPGSGVFLDQSLGFNGVLEVVDRIFNANSENGAISLALNSVSVKTKEDALNIMQYFETGFGLFPITY
jgi:hypothetical protein